MVGKLPHLYLDGLAPEENPGQIRNLDLLDHHHRIELAFRPRADSLFIVNSVLGSRERIHGPLIVVSLITLIRVFLITSPAGGTEVESLYEVFWKAVEWRERRLFPRAKLPMSAMCAVPAVRDSFSISFLRCVFWKAQPMLDGRFVGWDGTLEEDSGERSGEMRHCYYY